MTSFFTGCKKYYIHDVSRFHMFTYCPATTNGFIIRVRTNNNDFLHILY